MAEPEREQWSSRAAYIVAAIGSAIGFGNVWRFPSLAFNYGGGAFFIPYILALLFIGIPILILESAIGQFHQTGDAGSFGRINKRFSGLGLASVFCGFIVNTYYCVLIAWVCRMFIFSCIGSEGRWSNVSAEQAYQWFQETVTGSSTVTASGGPTRLVGYNVLALAFVWVFIFVSLGFGVKWTGRLSYVTVGLPILILFILVIRTGTLDNAGEGIRSYVGRWDLKVLSERGDVWSKAVTQVFFSLGVTLGILTAYASYNERNSPVVTNSLIIAISNSFFSFIAGFAVFATAGYIAERDQVPLESLKEIIGGPSLMFGAFPVAFSTLPGAGHWERLFFVALFMLGIDSAFALAEAVTTVIHDTVIFQHASRLVVTGVMCILGFLSGLLYCTDAGLTFLDAADFYINFMLLLVGFFECFAVGWVYGLSPQTAKVGTLPVYSLMATALLPVCLSSGVWFGMGKRQQLAPDGWSAGDWSLLWGFFSLVLTTALGLALTWFFVRKHRAADSKDEKLPTREYFIELFMGNVLHLRRELSEAIPYLPTAWLFLIRFVIPQLLLVLFANLAASENTLGQPQFGYFGLLPKGYQVFGLTLFAVSAFIIAFGLVIPNAYKCFSVKTIAEDERKEEEGILNSMESTSQTAET